MSADASTLALPSSLPVWVRHLPNCFVEVPIEHASLVEEPSTREEHRDEQRPLYSVQRRTLPTVRHQRHSDLEQAHGRECGVGRPLAGAVTVDTSDLATAGAFAMLLVLVSFSGSPLMCPASNRLQECF